ncbi:MAG: VacB/RNase II family 3'-5' exoribonuclease [bacterium]
MPRITKEEIIRLLEQTEQRPVAFRRLMADLGVNGKAMRELKSLLEELIESGQIIRIKGGKYGLSRKMNLVSGHVSAHPSGYGFVVPDTEGQADIFIPPDGMREVFDGDRVMARIDHTGRDGRRSGSIIRVMERAHKTVIGCFEKTRHISFVVPNNPSLTQDIIIPKENKGIKPRIGQLVVAQILDYPTRYRNPTGRIVEVLGWPDDPGIDVEVVVRDSELPDVFPESIQGETQGLRPELAEADLTGRMDLRNLLTITIDGETARDFDDAVSWQPLTSEAKGPEGSQKGGRERLWVHIADVSHYVPEGSGLDEEAFSRGTSVYFPERAIPMLPPELSNELCSLKPRVDRLTLSVRMDFDADARVVDYAITLSVINSSERMTYTQVRDILSEQAQTPAEFQYLEPTIKAMGDLAARLRRKRMMSGSLDFDLPEPEVVLDLRGSVQSIIRAERNQAHNLIEEFMLIANQVVAEHMSRLKVPVIYRIHEEPEEADVVAFIEFIHELGWEAEEEMPAGGKPPAEEKPPKGKTKRPSRRKGIKARLEHADLQRILSQFRGKPEEASVNYLLLRTMRQARYSTQNAGHFGLAIKEYTHFTSPIRRYPDLIVHRLMKKVLDGEADRLREDVSLPERLAVIANHSSLRERIAEEAERKIIDIKRTRYMEEKIGEEFTGIISSVTAFGFFVELEEIFVEGLVHIRNLADDYYQFNERKHRLEGSRTKKVFRIGDRVTVRVSRIDVPRLHIDFTLATKSN